MKVIAEKKTKKGAQRLQIEGYLVAGETALTPLAGWCTKKLFVETSAPGRLSARARGGMVCAAHRAATVRARAAHRARGVALVAERLELRARRFRTPRRTRARARRAARRARAAARSRRRGLGGSTAGAQPARARVQRA